MRGALAAAIRRSGLAWLVRLTWARRRVSIVLYHDPDPESLGRQLTFLGRRYTFVELGTVVDALRSGEWSALPPRGLVVTIDDGHAGNAALAPVFAAHRVRPTIFVCTRIVGTGRRFWFEHVGPAAAEEIKGLSNAQRLEELRRRWDFEPGRDFGDREPQALSASQLAELARTCDLESHTRTHPILTSCTEAEAREEIAGSRPEIETIKGGPCRHLAYPNGCYGERELEIARVAGYDSARSVDVGWVGPRSHPYRLPILSVADGASDTVLAAELTGLKWLSRLVRREGTLGGRFRPRFERRRAG